MGIEELALSLVGRVWSALRNRPSLVLKISAARGVPDSRPGLALTIVNPGPTPVVLKSVGVELRGAGRFGVDAQPSRLEQGDEAVGWIDLGTLAKLAGIENPVEPIQSVFAVTTTGSARRSIDAKVLLAELSRLYPAS